jgi:hypothetical protein
VFVTLGFIAATVGLALAVLKVMTGFRTPQRIREIQHTAKAHGLLYADTDPFSTVRDTPMTLLRRGDEQRVLHTMWDPDDRDGSRVFDLVWAEVYKDRNGREHRRYHQQTCALAPFPVPVTPRLLVVPEGVGTRVATMLGTDDIDVESIAVNRRYAIRCSDRRFALAFVDPRVQGILEGAAGDIAIEVVNGWLLLVCEELAGRDFPAFRRLADDLGRRPPAAVRELFRLPRADGGS